ncbi:hypothetical protein OG884_09620 [Streptosporangium sp. NBC_01755]|uniref:hypothetical protein n=1 Tax=unclassified Streptosporangium TaxID=2632669 RepID=UPI002DDA2B59|nr:MULTISPECIES: hypothetical protein [unclassified Streptosporangium]WSA26420.1 hypothetical protein OIE13_00495 [Streptosporangium sp. NBC_01810]WSD02150.1 hypothetical protein OG884_09620 [Streptosporangium sp. NBC_01755]
MPGDPPLVITMDPCQAAELPQHTSRDDGYDRAPRALALRFTGWCLWYGKATGHWWALSPVWCRQRIGLIEADTPAELAAQMQHIENFHPHLAPDQPNRPLSTKEAPHPGGSTDVKVAGNPEHNGIASTGGDRDGNAPAVRTRRRTR